MTLGGAASPLGALVPLAGQRFARLRNVVFFDSLPSTNDVAKRIVERMVAEDSDIEPVVIVARDQTAGRGRAGRTWTAPAGSSLTASLIAPWSDGPARIRVPIAIGVALAKGIGSRFGLDVRLKWPNDLLVGRKKLGGILVEARATEGAAGYVVIGIGLNVRTSRADLDEAGLPQATSLALESVPPASLAGDAPLLALLDILDRALGTPPSDLQADFESVSAHAPGDRLVVRDGGRETEGSYLGVTADGLLRLSGANGVETVVSGDVAVF